MSNEELLRKVQGHLYEALELANKTAEKGMRPSTHIAFRKVEEAHMDLAAYMEDDD